MRRLGVLVTALLLFLSVLVGFGSPAQAAPNFPSCVSTGRTVIKPFPPGTTLASSWKVSSPPANATYDLTGVTSTAYPSTSSPFALGTTTPPSNLCLLNGTIHGTTDDAKSWNYYHDTWNASCIRMIAIGWVQANGLRCNDIEDGLKFLENTNSQGNTNVTKIYSKNVWLNRVRDDCVENDFTLGGILYDSLYERCNTGVSERPASSNGTWTSPLSETLTLDHMLIGLWDTNHDSEGLGSNTLFKWSTSGNKLVMKCSTFLVPSKSLNGASSMDLPARAVVNDAACPAAPTTIVWLGGGGYPGNLHGLPIRVTSDRAVWDSAVARWKSSH